MEKEFIPYEQALKLKQLGFDEPCFATIDQTEFVHINGTEYPIRGAMDYITIDLPTFSQAFRWFRKNYGDYLKYSFGVAPHFTIIQNLIIEDSKITYEEAELACLNKLIEIVESNKEQK
jgi:hypothetical protein